MKMLLNTLYIQSPDRYLCLEGETVVVKCGEEKIGQVPLHNVVAIVTCGHAGVSPALLGACAERGIIINFMDRYCKFLARTVGPVYGNVILRKEQYRVSDDPDRSVNIAKSFIKGKIYNQKSVLARAVRDHPQRIDVDMFNSKIDFLRNSLTKINTVTDADMLRGIEGEAASVYFSAFDSMILRQKEDFRFSGRNKRPSLDRVNALLNFAYSRLRGMCESALESVGLDPYVGFLHTDRPGRTSLALDLMEEFRAIYADRFVLTLINDRIFKADDFKFKENGEVYLEDSARREFFNMWEKKRNEEITHPYTDEKTPWGMLPHVQARLLVSFLRGDMDAYMPFMWK